MRHACVRVAIVFVVPGDCCNCVIAVGGSFQYVLSALLQEGLDRGRAAAGRWNSSLAACVICWAER